MKELLLVGIGAGDPDYITQQALKALRRSDVIFLMDKGPAKHKLNALRREICARFLEGCTPRFAEGVQPERERDAADYRASVDELNRDKQAVFEQLIDEQMSDGEVAAFMVWGDPSLYDSSIRIIESIASARSDLSYDVIPGITSLQALTARHRVPLNQIGRAVEITTGRLLAEGWPQGVDSVAVMLDAKDTYLRFVGQGLHIYWGAYVGTADEILIAGALDEVAERIAATRTQARENNGWIMDSYLLRRGGATES
ncbi:precorrin-6A synthase (deacetylating) [Aquipseudomonas alcaligenes]|uniref:Precorrin-6A synthase (Deacetylating) n=1 Tax=Aquipseudomonas alcaligenes TaxID=43263 RepID=A0AA37FLX4_AQUAC|nr:precorrin-6A synthase (deacetylating) [Pseudomonas alcaligenes]BCR25276.1 precorrin-6A synthase (deacetylating) [Pseudomonas alcaligenes]GIZ66985.1 precorrin-6A synthase (deacetylating) [Pseudomonas alcaligenes]GIZ71588.1 precorrin-6A synthase (deacetylating) [Pseudomonas alcaligenes]GIZ75937.1 precorrin-6A synthase (deacetylating) [Pseudomonas alcaligenes]GIZ79963.1 precorrin-6A synthase (deacetylating) [Pseudomonas alcaligenes]